MKHSTGSFDEVRGAAAAKASLADFSAIKKKGPGQAIVDSRREGADR
jgi:hypothetical protein